MKRIKKIDWLIYKLFYWRWNKIFEARPKMFDCYLQYMIEYKESIKKSDV